MNCDRSPSAANSGKVDGHHRVKGANMPTLGLTRKCADCGKPISPITPRCANCRAADKPTTSKVDEKTANRRTGNTRDASKSRRPTDTRDAGRPTVGERT